MTSPTARSLALLRKEGWTAQVVEKFNQFAMVRVDLFGCIDIVAIKTGNPGVLGIQATSRGNMSTRIKKIMALPEARLWVECSNKLEVWGWDKYKKHWRVRREIIVF